MTGSTRPLCDCPDPCACYAEGYAAGCSGEPCLATRTFGTRRSPSFLLVNASPPAERNRRNPHVGRGFPLSAISES